VVVDRELKKLGCVADLSLWTFRKAERAASRKSHFG
jgi:hypothetical protein